MNYEQAYRKLISGQSSGALAAILRLFLAIASLFYATAICLRNFLYSKGWLKTHTVNVPVISIGNITVGGTGKTPLVIWLCNKITQNLKLKTQNYGCAILTRGYKTHTKGRGTRDEGRGTKIDEPAILSQSCPNTKVIVNPDRVAGAAEAVNKFGAKVLVMDDGFQHRRLKRDADIVAIDATCPFGYGKMLPAGLLREPTASLKRADAVVITRCDQVDESELNRLEEQLQSINPDMIIARSIHKPVFVKLQDESQITIDQLKGKKVFAFCGIGNPDAFLSTVKQLGVKLVGSKIYDDHHHYANADLADIYEQAGNLKADLILTTQKDWTKITPAKSAKKDMPFAYLQIELKFVSGQDKITQLIEDALAGKILPKLKQK